MVNTKKISCFCTDGKISVRINLPLFSTVVPASIFMFLSCRPFVATRPVDNVVIATRGLQDRNINILAGTTVENKGKLILTEIFQSVQKHDIFLVLTSTEA